MSAPRHRYPEYPQCSHESELFSNEAWSRIEPSVSFGSRSLGGSWTRKVSLPRRVRTAACSHCLCVSRRVCVMPTVRKTPLVIRGRGEDHTGHDSSCSVGRHNSAFARCGWGRRRSMARTRYARICVRRDLASVVLRVWVRCSCPMARLVKGKMKCRQFLAEG